MAEQEDPLVREMAALRAEVSGLRAAQTPAKKGGGCLPILGGIFALIIVGMVIAALNPDKTPRKAAPPVDPSVPHAVSPDFAATLVKPHLALREPDSAQFSDAIYRTWMGIPVVCGAVNARNGFGGMTGKQAFIMVGNEVAMGDQTPRRKFDKLWKTYCVDPDPGSRPAGSGPAPNSDKG